MHKIVISSNLGYVYRTTHCGVKFPGTSYNFPIDLKQYRNTCFSRVF